jgi:hypothetical protein
MGPPARAAVGAGDVPVAGDETMNALYAHVCHMPPHGPFAYLSAATLAQQINRKEPVLVACCDAPIRAASTANVSALRMMDTFQSLWNVDHLRLWPSSYAAAELRVSDVHKLPIRPHK